MKAVFDLAWGDYYVVHVGNTWVVRDKKNVTVANCDNEAEARDTVYRLSMDHGN